MAALGKAWLVMSAIFLTLYIAPTLYARLTIRESLAAECRAGAYDITFCANVESSLTNESGLAYALRTSDLLPKTIAVLIVAFLVALCWRGIIALWQRLVARNT